MKLPELLTQIRDELQDRSASPRWSDTLLTMYIRDAISDYSRWLPRRVVRYELTTTNSWYSLPADYIEDVSVEYPVGTYLYRGGAIPGRRYFDRGRPIWYVVQDRALYLNCDPPSDPLYLTYLAYHTMPTDTADTTVPDPDIELLRLYVSAMVHRQMRARQSRLDRFDPTAGRRDDNPLTPEAESLLQEYYNKISMRVRGQTVYLYRRNL